MAKEDKQVTSETKAEAQRLRALWDSREHPNQTVFGEKYDIGNQSAVGQFLRGDLPLSLKAARGFAIGLGCRIEEFSPRLAREAAAIASVSQIGGLLPEVAEVAAVINSLPPNQRKHVLDVVAMTIGYLGEAVRAKEEAAVNGPVVPQPTSAKRAGKH